jgi:acyl carrier protein
VTDVEAILAQIQTALQELDIVADVPTLEALGARRWRDLGIDSLKILEVVMCLEETYSVEIESGALVAVVTFGDLAAVTRSLLQEGTA